ncbi:hypothetical protein [Pseudooceanicola algae]|uniref:Uncharacterized protein n=1 Tax=Pseudooceanicola algae TaxID=1537215 RepID=A0A418SJS6_9RHOB|nr:hypothetical protein [Pseudooceanicola algae]QPM90654.1 hypothetical protein PSAL_018930 [Pseudooceanicola algae]
MVIFAPIFIVLFLFVAWKMYSPSTRNCRWRLNRALNKDGKTYQRCVTCGVEVMTEDGAPPKVCLAGQAEPQD